MKKTIILATTILATLLFLIGTALANTEFAAQTGKQCTYCHNADYTLNIIGQAFKTNGNKLPAAVVTPVSTPKPTSKPITTAPKVVIKKDPINTVRAIKVMQAPSIDAQVDNVWNQAKAIEFDIAGAGVTQGGTGGKFKNDKGISKVYIKALYDKKNVYFLIKYGDPTASLYRGPWVMKNGKLIKKDYRKDGAYEDKFAILWQTEKTVKDFDTKGCTVLCHVTKDKDGKAITKHWTNGTNELLDMWHMKIARQNTLNGPNKPAIMHDQYMDNVKYNAVDATTENAGRHSDTSDPKKEYSDNATKSKADGWGEPKFVVTKNNNGNKFAIVEGLDVIAPFTPAYLAKMKNGDTIPGFEAYQIKGDGADITAKSRFYNGMWITEISRPLTTTSDKDVQFKDLAKLYPFAFSGFDNSQIGHAMQSDISNLRFVK